MVTIPGPAPNPNARRRNARPDWVTLPAEGYQGDVPSWPLVNDPSESERELWLSLWRTPQASQWVRGQYERVVARYCMIVALSEVEPTAAILGEVRQMEDRLGLSPMSLKRLQWEIPEQSSAPTGLAEVKSIDRFADL